MPITALKSLQQSSLCKYRYSASQLPLSHPHSSSSILRRARNRRLEEGSVEEGDAVKLSKVHSRPGEVGGASRTLDTEKGLRLPLSIPSCGVAFAKARFSLRSETSSSMRRSLMSCSCLSCKLASRKELKRSPVPCSTAWVRRARSSRRILVASSHASLFFCVASVMVALSAAAMAFSAKTFSRDAPKTRASCDAFSRVAHRSSKA
mmetsp:Transcript_43834/g.103646  ORF Transcript_43834/g.103646 Transcript_43834/m.103646 type:complete len:206 (-) Transcript_43834:1205-1822(-)